MQLNSGFTLVMSQQQQTNKPRYMHIYDTQTLGGDRMVEYWYLSTLKVNLHHIWLTVGKVTVVIDKCVQRDVNAT